MSSTKTISVIGCGYVGLTTATVLASCGYKVYAVEKDPKRLSVLKSGKSFFYEPGIDELIAKGLDNKNLIITDDLESSVAKSDIMFSCVGTPDNPDGSSDLTYVFGVAEQASKVLKPKTIFVQKSTVPVGTGQKVKAIFAKNNCRSAYVSNPEFLREGSAIHDTLFPDRIVVGGKSSADNEAVIEIYKSVIANHNSVAKIANITPLDTATKTNYISTTLASAELIKVTANAFLALKISFANSIAKLADKANANAVDVLEAVGADKRIGNDFLKAGRGYGGGCFPKDVSGLIHSAHEYGVNLEIMKSATAVNESMPEYIVAKALESLGKPLNGRPVVVLGLAFKAGTSDTRRSPAITIANLLVSKGAKVKTYDPQASQESKEDLDQKIVIESSLSSALKNTKVIFVATDWDEFVEMDLREAQKLSKAELFVDCMNRFDSKVVGANNFKYVGVGQ